MKTSPTRGLKRRRKKQKKIIDKQKQFIQDILDRWYRGEEVTLHEWKLIKSLQERSIAESQKKMLKKSRKRGLQQ